INGSVITFSSVVRSSVPTPLVRVKSDMLGVLWLAGCSAMLAVTVGFDAEKCRSLSVSLNVVLLEDEDSLWSLKYVRFAVEKAIEDENLINNQTGLNFTIKSIFRGFNTTFYRRRGCGSSTCEGVEILKSLHNSSELGCAMLGPSCTYATFQLVDQDVGLTLTIPVISAGSSGLSCDGKEKLTRLLPPARKVSSFFVHFWNVTVARLKPKRWERAYVYKQQSISEECFWYINALEAATAQFSTLISRKVLRSKEEIYVALSDPNRHSNIFILCGGPDDILSIKNEMTVSKDIAFILIDIFNHGYHINASSFDFMRDVLVLTMHSVRNYSLPNWPYNSTTLNDYIAGYYDGVVLFSQVMRAMLLSGQGQGTLNITANLPGDNPFRNLSFEGLGGRYDLDESGDRNVNFSLMYTTSTIQYKTLFVFDTSNYKTTLNHSNPDLPWPGSRLPDDRPANGLEVHDIIMIVLGISVVLATAIAFIFYRQNRKQRYNQKKWSHINSDLIAPLDNREPSYISLKIDEDKRRDSTYQIRRGRYDKKLMRIDYYNLTKFYGTVKYEYGVFGVFEYCERGSLRYVLNDKISYPDESFMDLEFKISVMYDIAKGMSYLHSSNIEIHGRLKSTNCVVDNRMVVKITDFGCNTILTPGKDLWTAPEHMRTLGISQKGDVYSFAVIAHEIIMRECPFYTENCADVAEKLYRVQSPTGPNTFRPDFNFETAGDREVELYVLIKSCWDEDPEKRPDFKKIENTLGKIFSNLHDQANASYMDNLIRRLQMYSRNLEHLVEGRTALYKAERDRADQLNFMLLPGPVVRSLKETGRVEPELFDEVTIYFSDIVGFTTLCHYSTPMEVVDMLNDMYKNFDSILDSHDVYKVETIGDAYMVASGLPRRNGNRHAVDICHMALDILEFMGTFQLRHLPGIPLWIRIGVHSGPCAAGVVGNKMPRYCLFGDTVNTASRMESTGLPLRIHVSQSTINILQRTDCPFEYETRGETFLKGKGKEMTYWLKGVTGQKYNLPTPPTATYLTFNNDKPWFTSKLRHLHQAKEDAFRNGDRVLYNQARNTLNKEIRVAKRSYAKNLENQLSSNDPASVWKGLKDITNYKTPSPSTEANQQLAEDLNEFYCRFETAGLTPHAPSEHLSTQPLTPPATPLSPRPALRISEDDVRQIFLKQKKRKSPGPAGSFERLVLAYLKNITGPLLDPLQFAYRANRSVDDAVNMGLHFILQHLDKSGTYLLKFADDTTVIGLIQDGEESAYRQEIEQLAAWCSLNNLELNTLKTVEMIVDFRRNTPALPPLTIMNSTVPTVESFRFLGTTISQDLKWDTHIDSTIKKAQQRLYFLRQLRKFNLPQELLIQLYSAVIEENFQRLQQDLADLIVSTLAKRGNEIRKTLSTRQRRSQRHGSDGLPEYLHLADPSTYL
ncbi:hypothetical protein QTP70_022935, partial [Hemibagrus guttatus]